MKKSDLAIHVNDAIIRAKDELVKLYDEKNIARKSYLSHPNVNVKHMKDILDLFLKKMVFPMRSQL